MPDAVAVALDVGGTKVAAGLVTADTSYTLLVAELFVMGLGMGATMMPLFTAALKTLRPHQVARGSTLLNITQQVASSIGVAVMSVLLTNHLKASPLALPAIASQHDPSLIDKIGGPAAVAKGLEDAASAFAQTYWVAWVLVVLTLIPALMLPRKKVKGVPAGDPVSAAATMGH